MKIEILSGNQAGHVVEMPQTEAENAIATGFGRLAAEPPSAKRSSRRKAVAPADEEKAE